MKASILLMILLVVHVQCFQKNDLGFDKMFEGFGDKTAISICLGMTKQLDMKKIQKNLADKLDQSTLNESKMRSSFKNFMVWSLGNCYDNVIESAQEKVKELTMKMYSGEKVSDRDLSKYLDWEEALGQSLNKQGRKHHLERSISNLLLSLEKHVEEVQKNPEAFKEKIDKMKNMNQKMTDELKDRMASLDSTKDLQMMMGLFAIVITVILLLACYCCFFSGKGKGDMDFDEKYDLKTRKKLLMRELAEIEKEEERLKKKSEKAKKAEVNPEKNESEAKPVSNPNLSENEELKDRKEQVKKPKLDQEFEEDKKEK